MVEVVHLWLASYGRVALIFAIALCLGYPVCRKTVRGPAAAVLAVLAGLALFSLAVCLLSWLRIFTGLAVVLLAVLAAITTSVCLVADASRWRGWWRRRSRPAATTLICFAVLALVLLGFSLLALYPATGFDSTSYHLPLARDLVRQHGLVYDPLIRYSFFPQANEAMFAVMQLLTTNEVACAALEYAVLGLIALALPLWFLGSGRSVGAGFLAGILVLASPVVVFAGTSAMVDTWTLTFVTAGMLVGLEAVEGRASPPAAMLLAGVMFGEAAATKYTGALFALAALVGVLIAGGRSSPLWRALPGVLGGAVVIALPWYAWTLHITGDPVYPFATGIFGNRRGLWTALELKLQIASATAVGDHAGVIDVIRRDVRYLRGNINYDTGLGRSPLSWLLALGVVRLAVPSGWRDRTYLGVAVAGLLSIFFSLFVSADPRYLVPAVGFFALGAGLTADGVISWSRERVAAWLRGPLPVAACCAACAAIGLWTSIGYARDFAQKRPPTSSGDIYTYLAARIPCFAATKYLNQVGGEDYRAWGLACEQARYFANGRLISDEFSVGSRPRIFNDIGEVMPSVGVFWARLEPLHVRWAILPVQTVPHPASLQVGGLFRYIATVGPERVFAVRPRAAS